MEIYLIRHTAPDVAAGICYGQTDLDVAASFADEFAVMHDKLRHLANPIIYSSPLQRCFKLASTFASQANVAGVTQDARLMELHFGDWEMLAWNDIPRGAIDVWADEHVMQSPPQGESFHALHQRTKNFLDEIRQDKDVEQVVVFTHSGVIRALVAEVLGLPLIHAFKVQVDYAGITQILVEENVSRVGYINR